MRVIVSGQRDWKGRKCAKKMVTRLMQLPSNTLIIHGNAEGADRMADKIAKLLGLDIKRYPLYKSDWKRHGKAAGVLRNQRMINDNKPDLVLCFFTKYSESKGTKDMLRRAQEYGCDWESIAP